MAAKTITVLFYGTPDFSVPILQALLADARYKVIGVVTQPDRPSGRGNKITASAVKITAIAHNLPVFQPERIRKAESAFLDEVRTTVGVPDIAVVVAFGQILPTATLEFPLHGSVNIHASILPRWRGAAPIAWSIIEGDKESGIAIMKMDAGMDTGGVYECTSIPLTEDETAGTLHDKLSQLGAERICATLEPIVTKKLTVQPQPNEGVTLAPKLTAALCQISWTVAAKKIEQLVRGLSPFPGAFTKRNNKVLKILHAVAKPPKVPSLHNNTAGTVVWADARSVEVLCGDGNVLELKVIQAEGRNKLSIVEFQNGASLAQGEVLG